MLIIRINKFISALKANLTYRLNPGPILKSNPATKERANSLFSESKTKIYIQTDRLFAGLMAFQWILGIIFSLVFSPKSWTGELSATHVHVWAAILLGGIIVSFPIGLALIHPGQLITRHVIAGSQMLMSALLIHLSGGRIETHFHIFGSLAFLAFYRDSSILATGSIVVALDHYLRGLFWPQSVFGVLIADAWRWLEHAAWVIFEDVFLIYSCIRGNYELWGIAIRQAELEISNAQLEARTVEMTASNKARGLISERLTEELKLSESRRLNSERLTEELQRSNADLERFAAIAAHDLRSPIATISSVVEAVKETIKDPSPEVEEYFQFLNSSTASILLLIERLLTYAGIGKSNHIIESVDLNKVVDDVLAKLGKAVTDSRAKVVYHNLPIISGDASIVGQLFQNLIANSIKFRGVKTPEIKIQLEHEDEQKFTLSLKDNGIGFTSKQAEIIFEPFKRLDSARQYEGSGLGLSTARRVVEMLGGRIWAESEEGKGAKFFFTISKSASGLATKVGL